MDNQSLRRDTLFSTLMWTLEGAYTVTTMQKLGTCRSFRVYSLDPINLYPGCIGQAKRSYIIP
jgi:hypothetical protein